MVNILIGKLVLFFKNKYLKMSSNWDVNITRRNKNPNSALSREEDKTISY